MVYQEPIKIQTAGRGTTELTGEVDKIIKRSCINRGICNIFIQHTSASLMLCENADPAVRKDLESFFSRLVPDADPVFQHTVEGPDDMPAHVRTVLTESSLNLPVNNGHCELGTWQGVYLWEHRCSAHNRTVVVTVYGDE